MSDMPLLPVIVRLTSAVNRAFRPGLILASLVALLAVVWSGSSQPALLRAPGPVQRVLVITLDGMRPDALLQTNAPSITALAARGAASWAAKTVLPAVTLPAHASILTGLDVSEHGLDHNNSIYPCTSIPAPTFITLARDAGYRTAMVVGKERMCQFLQRDDVNYTFARAAMAASPTA